MSKYGAILVRVNVIERSVVRVVVLDALGQVLLFHTRDPTYPELGTWWELPGGGIEPGETVPEAAIRELAEETGIAISSEQVGAPTWRRRATFRYRGKRLLNNEVVVVVRLSVAGPPVDGAARVGFEDEDYFDYRWYPMTEIVGSTDRFYPGRLPELLGPFLDGEEIDEPFEQWS
ncbi:NUDIX domain-containing protein [Plantactinospora sp. S1510]|uniref:NUDIX domain-containing protein n=1 Tax=Plantactinospora alkalitolerans TaxID=2789879 RepID=A0ABS0GWA7_9ACTN|nr:NUDIX domain-containing protein [Plantactinospora alkalitolerans]